MRNSADLRSRRLTVVVVGIAVGIALLAFVFVDRSVAPHGLVVDWPDGPVERTYFDTGIDHLYVAPRTADGFDLTQARKYEGDSVAFDQFAWMPTLQSVLTYARNERPGEMWLIAIQVPSLERLPLSAIPLTPRGDLFSPLFAVDPEGERLFVTDQQRFCGFKKREVWHVWDAARDSWESHPFTQHALVTLDYAPERDVLVGVGYDFEEKTRVIATFSPTGTLIEQREADVCAMLDPAQFGYDKQTIRSQLREDTVVIERQLYYGKHAKDGQYWENQIYEVEIDTGRVSRAVR